AARQRCNLAVCILGRGASCSAKWSAWHSPQMWQGGNADASTLRLGGVQWSRGARARPWVAGRCGSPDDPYGCNTNPTTGLTGSKTGTVSVYRRVLPTANLGFLSTIMWDGREPSLFSQAVDATLGHAEAAVAPTAAQQQQI